jgi:hypothetical protein
MKQIQHFLSITIAVVILVSLMACGPSTSDVDWKETSFQNQQKEAISDVMAMQEAAWNEADIDQFMEGYWKSEKLRFSGSNLTFGWDNTKNNYKKSYPDNEAMGKLMFEIIEIELTSAESALLFGRYTLIRNLDKPTGLFTLAWRKIDGKWLITSDMTCG